MSDRNGETSNANDMGKIVSGSKVVHEGEVYIVGQIKGNRLELLKGSFGAGFVNIDEVEVL